MISKCIGIFLQQDVWLFEKCITNSVTVNCEDSWHVEGNKRPGTDIRATRVVVQPTELGQLAFWVRDMCSEDL
jgi:hypothetical protein